MGLLKRGKTLSNFRWIRRSIKINASGTVLSTKLEPHNVEIKIIKKKLVYIHQALLLNRAMKEGPLIYVLSFGINHSSAIPIELSNMKKIHPILCTNTV